MAYTPNPPWKDWPDTSTQHTAATDNNVETGILDASNRLDIAEVSQLTSGEANMPRMAMSTATMTSGQCYFSFFTALKTETINTATTYCGSAQGGTAPSICKVGIYSVAGNGDLTLITNTANDTALWNAGGQAFSKTLSPSWSKVKGTRYATGILIVTIGTTPQLMSATYNNSAAQYLALSTAPRLFGIVTGQTDLPASVAVASLSGGSAVKAPYVEFTP